MNLQVPEKKKRKTKMKTDNSSPPPSPPSFSSLPDDMAVNCLARISRWYYPTLSTVSKMFRSLVSSTELYAARSHLGSTEIQLLVPIPASNLPSLPSLTTVAVGAEIYAIGGPVGRAESSSAVRVLDCLSDTWRDAPSMIVARRYALSCVCDGKIYVCGGVDEEEPWGEVFDTKTQTWGRLPDPGTEVRTSVRTFQVWGISEGQGKIYIGGDSREKIVYDTKQCKWEWGQGKGKVASSELFYTSPEFEFPLRCNVYDVEEGYWKPVKGLDSLSDTYRKSGGSLGQRVRCGEKLFVIWEGGHTRINPCDMKKIWCAVIVLEKRHGGEIWGNVECVDVVHSVPTECRILHCHVVLV
ncbi:unnamed protein product [Microthlaspi erraticum]|uniref:F-box domain-containing protein n=1 Tax=Microthlaspi erraticum TaxID=1685480 RepID=A0A6D2JS04_9BRAS|nr:unnamed protein product [Microthlaspi erraticum]